MFVGMGVSAVIPVVDGLSTYGLQQMRSQIGLVWLVLQGALYILGAGLYAVRGIARSWKKALLTEMTQARWPETTAPGKFDVVGSSHQIFHVLVVLAAVSHLVGLIIAFDYRHGHASSCS